MAYLDNPDLPYGGGGDDLSGTRELVLVILEQLSISFDKLSRLKEAEPYLDKLMTIAYTSNGYSKFHQPKK